MLFALRYFMGRFVFIMWVMMGYFPTIAAANEVVTLQGELKNLTNSVSTMDWVVSYRNQSSQTLTNVVLTNTLTGGHALISTTVQAPYEWSVMYSTDNGKTYGYDNAVAGINAIKFSNPYVLPNGEGEAHLMPLPLTGGIKMAGGGDGFAPILMPNGKVMGVNHHLADAVIWCYDMNARSTCLGYPKKLGAANGVSPMIVRKGLRLYIGDDSGGSTYGQVGKLYCWDADANVSCGSSPVVEGGGYTGPVDIDNKLYVWTRNGKIDCYDPQLNLKRCAGFTPVDIGFGALDTKPWWENGNDLLEINARLYIANSTGKLACFDPSTQAKCSDWSVNPLITSAGYSDIFKRLNASGKTTGLCVAGYKKEGWCYDFNGANKSVVALAAVHAVQVGVNSQGEVYHGSRVLFPQMYPDNSLGCWDWATSAPCTGSYMSGGLIGKNVAGLPYGLAIDGVCAYSFGDEGVLMSWDIESGATPCQRTSGSMQVRLKNLSCSGSPTNTRWDKVKILDTNLVSGTDFRSLKVKVLNATTGAVLIDQTEAINTNGEMDISFIPASVKELELIAYGEPVADNAWKDGIPPKVALMYTTDQQPQFCYKSTLICHTNKQPVTNQLVSNYGTSITKQIDACNLAPIINVFNSLDYLSSQEGVVVDVYSTDDKDAESNGLTYTLSGPDAALFNINADTGVITFKTAPDYANPLDADKNNFYQVVVKVVDRDGAITTQDITIKVESDLDGDGIKDDLDSDLDGDGVPNDQEGDGDLDGDGIPSIRDPNEIPTALVVFKVLLQGAYDPNTKLMRDDLRRLGLLPLEQPYGAIVNSMYDGVEVMDPSLLKRTDETAPVDWVLIELRKADAQASLVSHRAGIVLRNGDIIDPMSGNKIMRITPVPAGYYYVVVRHRNHAAIVTLPPVWLSSAITPLDFTQPGASLSGGSLAQVIQDNKSLMSAGDGTQDGRIIVSGPGNDVNIILDQILREPSNQIINLNFKLNGYNIADYDLNGSVVFSGPSNDTNTLMNAIISHQGNVNKNMNYVITSGLRTLLDSRPLLPYSSQK